MWLCMPEIRNNTQIDSKMFDKYAHTPKNMLTHGVLGARGVMEFGCVWVMPTY